MGNAERQQMLDLLMKQEKEILESAKERIRLREAIALQEEQSASTTSERQSLLTKINEQQAEVRKLLNVDMNIIPKQTEEEMTDDELADTVVRLTLDSLDTYGPTKIVAEPEEVVEIAGDVVEEKIVEEEEEKIVMTEENVVEVVEETSPADI